MQVTTACATVTEPSDFVARLAPTKQVVLIIAPYLTWEDIDATNTPHIFELTQNTAIGNLNARSRVKDFDGKPSLLEGAMSISSGAWSRVDTTARHPFDIDETVEGVQGAEMYERLVGGSVGNTRIAYLGLPRMIAVNANGDFTVIPGLLGSAIEDAGGVTAAIGNSDLGYRYSADRLMRPAALIAMNEDGLVRLGSVSGKLLTPDPLAPYGTRTNLNAMDEEMRSVAEAIGNNQPSLIVIDSGDLYRARSAMRESTAEAAKNNWDNALSTLDKVYVSAREIYPEATIFIASQASMNPNLNREGLGPVIVSEPNSDMAGHYLSADSTQRQGLSTSLDLSATIYYLLDIPASVAVIGTPFHVDESFDDRQEYLIKSNNTALAVDSLRGTVLSTFIWTIVTLLAAGAFVLMWANNHWKPKTVKWIRRALYTITLGCLSIPAASVFMFFFNVWPQTPGAVLWQLLASTFIIWALALLVMYIRGGTSGIIFLGALTSIAIIIDQMLGAPFSFSGFFSYSTVMAFRFYGLGNEGAALLYGATIIPFVLWLDRVKNPHRYTTWVLAIGGFFVMLVCAAPWWGANVGVAAWATIGYAVLLLLANNQKVTWKSMLLMLVAIVLVLGVLIAVDMLGTSGETHLARSIGMAEQDGGIAPLVEIVVRKAATNFRVLTGSLWGVFFVAVIGFLIAMRVRPTPELTRTLQANKFFGDGMTAILVGGIAAFFTEDSGIVLPAIMVLYLGCALLWLMLERLHGKDDVVSESLTVLESVVDE